MEQAAVLRLLQTHQAADAQERDSLQKMITFVASTTDFHSRRHPAGHLTASGWIVNAAGSHALLIHHAKLKRWLQPGGHLEAGDASLAAAALREVMEETGLHQVQLANLALLDVDAHIIPARQ